jgi:glycosyltransferase involved in cell wall biosynthesis
MPSPAPEPLTSRPLVIWLVNPFDDIPGEGTPPLRYWSLARVLADRGHDVTWWTATWSHRRKAFRTPPLGIREDEGFAVRMVGVRPYHRNVSLRRIASHRDFGNTFQRLASEGIASGQLSRPDIILASLPPLESPEATRRLATMLDATFILDVMDLWPETFERVLPGPAFLRRIIAPFFLGNMAARRLKLVEEADALSAATNTYAATAFTGAPAETPRHVCLLGAYVDEFPEPPRQISDVPRLAAGPAATSPTPLVECVYGGSLETSQDVEILPAVARHLSAKGIAATIHVAGTGTFEANLRRAADATKGSCRLVVHGLLERPEYVRLVARCAIGLVCVKPESMVAIPYKAFDYAAAGLAIVNSLPGELAGLVEHYEAGVTYAAGDARSLADAIAGIAADRKKLLAMRVNARRLAEREFDREKTYASFADWIETVHGGG